jgi:hypothetical protein
VMLCAASSPPLSFQMNPLFKTILVFLRLNSQSGYVCMVFYRRDSHVVEFQAGEAAPAPDEACSAYYFNPVVGHLTTLIGTYLTQTENK